MADPHDMSNGYEPLADEYAVRRDSSIGVAQVRDWARMLPPGAAVIDLGCGTGEPLGAVLMQAGCLVYGVDASPRMAAAFAARFPGVPVVCEAIEESAFFGRTFDAALAWGVLFLLPMDTQARVIQRVAAALHTGGRFLFTSPAQSCSWRDALTGRLSVSPGADAYRRLLADAGLTILRELEDEGDNHYYDAVKA